MAPAVASSTLLSAVAAASKKRPADSDALPPIDSSPPPQGDEQQEASTEKKQNQKQQQLECPRCRSTNTKFCYYNNYSTSQPRHFCRACRRYWTHGGTLRDVPVGGATRRAAAAKRRRVSDEPSSSPSPPPPTSSTTTSDAYYADLPVPAAAGFPFLSDGAFLPHFGGLAAAGVAAPAAFSWQPAISDLYNCGIAPWDDGTAVTGAAAWDGFTDIAGGLDLTWPPPGN